MSLIFYAIPRVSEKTSDISEKTSDVFEKTSDVFEKTSDVSEKKLPNNQIKSDRK